MKMQEALDIINGSPKSKGYMVSYEEVVGNLLYSGHFPEINENESLIKTEEEAWELAKKFAKNTVGKYVNIYVIDDTFSPVPNYRDKLIANRK